MNHDEAYERLAGLDKLQQPTRTPKGWEPGLVWHGDRGEITTPALDEMINEDSEIWGELLKERGLDTNKFEIVGGTLRWCSFDGWKRDAPGDDAYSAVCYSYKAAIQVKRDVKSGPDMEELFIEARKRKPKVRNLAGSATLVVPLSDWQIGNADDGGVKAQIESLAALPELIVDRIKRLRKVGYTIERVVLVGMGDLVEGTCNFYPDQTFTVQLDRRKQMRVVRRALVDIVMAVADNTTEVYVTAVGGNHGEHRGGSGGKAHTGDADNDDVGVFEQVMEIIAASAYENVTFALPDDELAIGVEVHGRIIGFTHGHVLKPQANAAEAVWNWWTRQAMGRFYESIADAEIVVTGHFHHFNLKQQKGRTVMVCPSLRDFGKWFGKNAGVRAEPGTLSFVVDDQGWHEIEILAHHVEINEE